MDPIMPAPPPSPTDGPDINADVAEEVLQTLNEPDLPDLLLHDFQPAPADDPDPNIPALNAEVPIPPDIDLDAAADLEIVQILLQAPLDPINLDDINLLPLSPNNNYVALHPVNQEPVALGDLHLHILEADFLNENIPNPPENPSPDNPEANQPEGPSEMDLIQLEYQLALTVETSESQSNHREFQEQKHKLNLFKQQKLKQNKFPLAPQAAPAATQIIHLSSHSILGDKRLPCEQNFQELDITKVRNIVAHGNFTDLAGTADSRRNKRCKTCHQIYEDLPKHLAQGPFGEHHEFDRLPPHLNKSLLIVTTMENTYDGITSRYLASPIFLYPVNSEKINNRQLTELKMTGENVPVDLELALESAAPIPVCGEHQSIFPSMVSLLFHLLSCNHTEAQFLCSSCNSIFSTSGLQHFIDVHGLVFPVTSDIPDLYNICKSISRENKEILGEFNRAQLSAIDRNKNRPTLFTTAASMQQTMPHRYQLLYKRLKTILPDLSIAYDLGLDTETWDTQILQLLTYRSSPHEIIEAHKLISQVLIGLQPPADAPTTISTLNYEVFMVLVSSKLNYLFRGAELVYSYDEFTTNPDTPIGLLPTGPHPLAQAPHRLLITHDMNFHAITLGTNILLRSGIHVQQAIRVLNLSYSKNLLHATASSGGLLCFPDEKGMWIQAPANQGILNNIEVIMETPNRKTLIMIEFNLTTNLQYIPHHKWKNYIHKNIEDYALHFFISLKNSRIKTSCTHPIIVIGQGPIFSSYLTLEETTKLSEYITRVLLKTSAYTSIPFFPTPGLIGFCGNSCVPLTTAPKGPVFADNGALSHYSVQQAIRIVQTCVSTAGLMNDCIMPPGFRFHMVLYFYKYIYPFHT